MSNTVDFSTLNAAEIDALSRATQIRSQRTTALAALHAILNANMDSVYGATNPDLVLRHLGTQAGVDSDTNGLLVGLIISARVALGETMETIWPLLAKPSVICLRQPDGRMRATTVPFPADELLSAMQAVAAQAEDPAAAMLGLLAGSKWTVAVEGAVEAEEYISGGYDAHAALFATNGLEVPEAESEA